MSGRSWPRCSAAVAVLAVAAAAGPGAGSAAKARKLTIELTSVTVSITPHDVRPKGASKGDTVLYRDRLLNVEARFQKPRGAAVGRDAGTMTFTGPHTATFKGKTTLPGGTLTLEGPVIPLANGKLVIPVSGGSGVFADATGTLTVGTGHDRVRNTYTLIFSNLPVA